MPPYLLSSSVEGFVSCWWHYLERSWDLWRQALAGGRKSLREWPGGCVLLWPIPVWPSQLPGCPKVSKFVPSYVPHHAEMLCLTMQTRDWNHGPQWSLPFSGILPQHSKAWLHFQQTSKGCTCVGWCNLGKSSVHPGHYFITPEPVSHHESLHQPQEWAHCLYSLHPSETRT